MTNDITKYEAPKNIIVTMPDNKGEIIVTPKKSDLIEIRADDLLIGTYLYPLSGYMKRVPAGWFYVQKPEIGTSGNRPTPKQSAAIVDLIAKTVTDSLENDTEFQMKMVELVQQEEQRQRDLDQRRIEDEYRHARRDLERSVMYAVRQRQNVQDAEKQIKEDQDKLNALLEKHPELADLPN